jgi:hypothetical protein
MMLLLLLERASVPVCVWVCVGGGGRHDELGVSRLEERPQGRQAGIRQGWPAGERSDEGTKATGVGGVRDTRNGGGPNPWSFHQTRAYLSSEGSTSTPSSHVPPAALDQRDRKRPSWRAERPRSVCAVCMYVRGLDSVDASVWMYTHVSIRSSDLIAALRACSTGVDQADVRKQQRRDIS